MNKPSHHPAIPPTAFQAILDFAPVGIWLLGPDGRLVFVNRSFCESVGIPEQRFLEASHYSELFDEATARSCMASDAAATAQAGPHLSREVLRFADGTLHHVEIVKAALRTRDGRPGGIVAIALDVTARVQAEALAEHQLEGYRLLNAVAAAPGMDVQAQLREAIRIGLRHLGLKAGAICHTQGTVARVLVEHGAAGFLAEGDALQLSETLGPLVLQQEGVLAIADLAATEHRGLRASLRFPVSSFVGVALEVAGSPYGFLGLASPEPRTSPFAAADLEFVTLLARWVEGAVERRAALAQLRDSQVRLAGIIDSAMDAIISVDEDQRVVLFNGAAEEVFGCRASEALGSSIDRFVPERFRARHHEQLRKFAATGATTRHTTRVARVTGLRAGGSEFPCEASVSRTQVGDRWISTVILRDVTEQVRAEEERRAEEARAQQAQRMEALGTLAGGIAHDFNNVLHVILMNAEHGLSGGELPPEATESLDAIQTAAERARDLVRRILTFSRRQPTRRAPLDVRPVLEETARFMRAVLPAGVRFTVALAQRVPLVYGDATEIQQVAMNLCSNAWQALRGNTGTIELRLEVVGAGPGDPATAGGERVCMTVIDTGRGMDEATRTRIFEPFFTTKEPGQGTGLGLSMVHAIVTQSGGSIEVSSVPGVGTTFRVLFPAAPLPADNPAPPSSGPDPATLSGARILLVDDEPLILRATSRVLSRMGYIVETRTRPEEAISAIHEGAGHYAAVVSDLEMPGMSGIDLAEAVRGTAPALPVIILSGDVSGKEAVRAAALAVDLLAKPCSADELGRTLKRALSAPGVRASVGEV